MDELRAIIKKYEHVEVDEELSSFRGILKFSKSFYADVAEIYDCMTRVRYTNLHCSGFEPNDAAILGLLVRAWKLLKEIVLYYQKNNGDMVSQLDRQFVESVIMAQYLMRGDESRIEDYRRCGYKSRLKMLVESKKGNGFFKTPAGLRLETSIRRKLEVDCFDEVSFDTQKKNNWKPEGRNFYQIFSEIDHEDVYKYIYGLSSESLHGSWTDSLDHHLIETSHGHYNVQPFHTPVDIRFITPLLRYSNASYRDWLIRIGIDESVFSYVFDWIAGLNAQLFEAFERVYDPDIITNDNNKSQVKESLFFQSFIDENLWATAKWDATAFETGSGHPPTIGVRFKVEDAARKIFKGWIRRLGKRDLYEELRISIVIKDSLQANNCASYHVIISSEPKNTAENAHDHGILLDTNRSIVVARRNEMLPSEDSPHLSRFLLAYLRTGSYYITPMTAETGLMHDLRIRKRVLHYLHSDYLSPEDPEFGFLRNHSDAQGCDS